MHEVTRRAFFDELEKIAQNYYMVPPREEEKKKKRSYWPLLGALAVPAAIGGYALWRHYANQPGAPAAPGPRAGARTARSEALGQNFFPPRSLIDPAYTMSQMPPTSLIPSAPAIQSVAKSIPKPRPKPLFANEPPSTMGVGQWPEAAAGLPPA